MIDSSKKFEKFLQDYRFRMVKPYIIGDVLDFGGNDGELKPYVTGDYVVVNYDHSVMESVKADTIVSLAVIEHIEYKDVFPIFMKFKGVLNQKGRIFLTTPTKIAHPVLVVLAKLGLLDGHNIDEHKHYWTKKEIYDLAEKSGFSVTKYKKFQFGFNQLAILEHM